MIDEFEDDGIILNDGHKILYVELAEILREIGHTVTPIGFPKDWTEGYLDNAAFAIDEIAKGHTCSLS